MAEHGSAARALEALPDVARAAGVKGYRPADLKDIAAERSAGERAGARLVAMGDPDYPPLLAQLSDAPPLLWMIGRAELAQKPMIALVGARNASSLGIRMAKKIATELGEAGHLVVSGLARGIDAAAHAAALKTGTVAVFAGGVDVVYPAENAVLAQEIAEDGLRISEAPMHLSPHARHFPARNRIISGMASAVVVVEAAVKSGSLITARNALDQGREVLAVPGHPFDARAGGCNLLIRDGARLVRGAGDVLDAIRLPDAAPASDHKAPEATAKPTQRDTAALHAEILDRLSPSPVAEDDLIRDLARSAGEVAPALVALELDGRIQREAGGYLSRSA
jgi:DNA processing protein